MREYKFKAWHKIEKRLFDVYGFDKDNVYEDSMNDYLETVVSRKYCDLIQYTGLQDVIGKDIYEGYICEWVDSDGNIRIDKVIFGEAKFYLCNNSYSITSYANEKLKVIGNIYENPELLERGFILIYQASKDYDIPLDVCQSIYEKDSTSFYDNLEVYIKERRLKANGR